MNTQQLQQQPPADGTARLNLKDEVFPTPPEESTLLSFSSSSSSHPEGSSKGRRYSTGTIFTISQRPLPAWNTISNIPAKHPPVTTAPLAVSAARTKSHTCPYAPCTLRFSTCGRLNKHVKSHTQEYICTYTGCDRRFGRSDGRDLHVLSEHEGVRWKCQFCAKEFRHSCSRRHHERVICGKRA